VLPNAASAKRSLAEFNYQESAAGEIQASEVFALAPSELFLCDSELDYALVALAPEPGLAAYGWLPLIEEQGKLLVGETVNIIQHPNGEPKQLAIRNNQVVDELELFLHYQTDTSPGSSGSPVFNDQWEVVALHHSGVPKRNAAGAVVTVDGREWQEWMGEQRIAWEANEGVRVSRLVQHIRQQSLPAEAETLRQELLRSSSVEPPPVAAQPPAEQAPAAAQPAPAAPQPPPAPAPPVATTTPAVASAPLPAGGAASWTIPLQLQVSLTVGSPTVTLAAEPSGPAASISESELWNPWAKKPAAPPPPPPTTGGADFRIDSLLQESFDWHTALSLGLASELAYSPAAAVRSQALAWGFQDCSFVEARAAQGFVASSTEVVLVSFRGTESTADWLSNLQVRPQTVAGLGRVHAGFWGQFTELQAQLESRLAMRQGVPLVVTGHSLGGAIAVLAAITWAGSHSLRALYTYGQPAVAQGEAVTAISTALARRYHRLVNDADIVPRVPPGYRHTGQLLHFNNDGKVTSPAAPREASVSRPLESAPLESASPAQEAPMLAESEFLMLQERLHRQSGAPGQEGASDLISDHMIPRYLEQIRRQPL